MKQPLKFIVIGITVAIATSFYAFAQESPTVAKFDGMFGVKFGTIISASKEGEVNNAFSLVYEYTPKKMFHEFSQYIIFSSPKTRTIYQVRAVYQCFDKNEVKAKIEEVVPILEAKFGCNAKDHEDGTFIRFPNGDMILITVHSYQQTSVIYIDAMNAEFYELNNKEVKQAKADILKEEITALQISPKPDDGNVVKEITGVFGKSFGEKLPRNEWFSRNDSNHLVCNIEVEKTFLDFSEYKCFAMPESREIFMFRAVYNDDDAGEIIDNVISLLEQLFGVNANEEDDQKYFTVRSINGNCIVLVYTRDDMIFLDIINISLYRKAME